MDKIEKVVNICENVLERIETKTLPASSALLKCLQIARLLNDADAVIWLQYEYGGYPRDKNGEIEKSAREIGYTNGRGYIRNGERKIFLTLAAELEKRVSARQHVADIFSTQGVSVSGERADSAMRQLTDSVNYYTKDLIDNLALDEKKLSILKAQYYDYALQKYSEFAFGNAAADVFAVYRERVDHHFSKLSHGTVLQLQAIEDKITSDNPEVYSQAVTTCRRLFQNTAEELFNRYFPDYSDSTYKTKSGKFIDISGNHYINKLSAVIEKLQSKSAAKSAAGSSILYTLDWIDNLNSLQCEGVHAKITRQDAMQCIIHTYICLGDILNLQDDYKG